MKDKLLFSLILQTRTSLWKYACDRHSIFVFVVVILIFRLCSKCTQSECK